MLPALRHKHFFKIILCVALLSFAVWGVFKLTQITRNDNISTIFDVCAQLGAACTQTNQSFDKELECIKKVQIYYHNRGQNFNCSKSEKGRTIDWAFNNKSGCCFDIARLIASTLEHFEFEIRHTSLHQMKFPFPVNYLLPTKSHAVVEVRTSKGWVLIGSTSTFIGIDKSGKLYTAKSLRPEIMNNRMDQFDGFRPENYFNGNYSVAYGLYSRHGLLYEPYVKYFPDIDWKQFSYNFK